MKPIALPLAVLLTLSGVILSHISASAAIVPNPVNSDYFVGFRASGGQGGSTSYLVRLGNASAFPVTEGTAFSLTGIGNIGLDLQATYGSNWFNRGDLFWGIFATNTTASPSVFGSRERPDPNLLSNPWPALDLTSRSSVDTNIGTNVLNGINGYRGSTATTNSPVGTFQANSANSTSYNFQVATAGTTDFGSLSNWTSIEGDFGQGTDDTVLDLWRLSGSTSTPVSYRGSFSIDDTGVVSYSFVTATPVPEPATLAWGAVGLVAVGLRRHRVRSVHP